MQNRWNDVIPVVYTCLCISLLPEQWKCYTKLTQLFLFHFLICVYSTHNLCFWLIDESGRTERKKELWVALSFSFYIIFNISDWLLNGSSPSKKSYIKILGHSCFLEHHCLLSAFKSKFWFTWCWAVNTSTYTAVNVMHLPDTLAFISLTLWDPGVPCSWGIMSPMCEWDNKEQGQTPILLISPWLKYKFHCTARLQL